MVKISFILPSYPWSPVGGFRVVYEYSNNLVKMGHDVSVIHPSKIKNSNRNKTIKNQIFDNLSIFKEKLYKPSINWHNIDPRVNILYVSEPIKDNVPDSDIVFATSWETAEYVMNYPKNKGEKYYLIQSYETWSGSKKRVDKTWLFPFKKVVIAKWLYENGLELGVSPNAMKHIPNGIDHNKYKLFENISGRSKIVSMLFHKSKLKGSEYGINALKLAKEYCPNLNAILFGFPNRPSSLPSWIEYIQNPSQDMLVRQIYNQSSIYLCSSILEGWHLPPAEAMACGCAVVSTNIGGVRDYAIDRKTALLSETKNAKNLAKNISCLLDDELLRVKIAKCGNKNIKKFNWERSTAELEKYFLEC